MQLIPSARALAAALSISMLATACGSETLPIEPVDTSTVSGVVKSSTGAAIQGASVKIGSASATTGADGQFELQNLPVGNVTMTTSAPRFDTRSETISLFAGPNTRNVMLAQQTMFSYENVVAYLRPEISEYKAAIVFLPGLRDPVTMLDLDARPLVRGTSELTCSIWCSPSERTEVRKRALELAGGNVALIGASTLEDNAASYQTLLSALTSFATQSLHPELANIPIFFVGHSMGGCTAYGFTRVHGARVAGFITMKGACHFPGPAAAAASVPGHFLIGAADAPYRKENITAVFEAGRGGGAPWAVSIDAFDHRPIADFDLMFDWIDAVLDARLPATSGGPLRAMTETEGWLGDRSSGWISTYACFGSSRSKASWLPSQQTALDWQRMAGGSGVGNSC